MQVGAHCYRSLPQRLVEGPAPQQQSRFGSVTPSDQTSVALDTVLAARICSGEM